MFIRALRIKLFVGHSHEADAAEEAPIRLCIFTSDKLILMAVLILF